MPVKSNMTNVQCAIVSNLNALEQSRLVVAVSWFRLPVSLRHTDCGATFKCHLKTLLFTAAYCV